MTQLNTQTLCGNYSRRGFNQGTASGRPFWAADPRREDIRIEDIAAQLSRLCRYGGALRDDVEVYSVAQHSVLVARNVPPEFALEGLLHDAAEAYTWDMIKPQKKHLPEACQFQDRIEYEIRGKYGLTMDKSRVIKNADFCAVCTERRDILPPNFSVDWGMSDEEMNSYAWDDQIEPWLPSYARSQFLNMFYSLTGDKYAS